MTLLTRKDLAKRWRLSVRTVDRLREEGILPFVDLGQGGGRKPIVRFRLDDILQLEASRGVQRDRS